MILFNKKFFKVLKQAKSKTKEYLSKIKNPLIFEKSFRLVLDSIPYYKGATNVSNIKQNIRKISKFSHIKKSIKSRINYRNNIREKYKRSPNISKNSYANRFLVKKNRNLYRKTILAPSRKSLSSTQEFNLFSEKEKAIYQEQKRHSFRQKFENYSRNNLLSNRTPKAAIISITHVRKNTFVVISTITGEIYAFNKKVSAKYSCGSIGYRNKKKTTEYAREQTIKAAGNFINYNRYTSIDIIYTSNVSFWNKKALRSLLPHPIYVRSLTMNYNRPHSYVRPKKAKRQ